MYENPAIGIKINHSKVRSVMRDKMNDLWLGIYQEGVYFSHMVSKNFSYYGKHSLSNNVIGYHAVQSVCKDSEGNMWVGTDGDGLYRVNLANNAVRHYEASEVAGSVSGTVSSLYNDSKGTLWVGSHDKGLTWINRSTGVCTAIPKLAKEKISYIGENHQKELLVGTRGAGVYVVSMETHEITHHYESSKLEVPDYIVDELCNDWINHVLCDSKGLLWIGHDMGLSCYDPVKKTFLRYHSSNNLLPGNTVHALCEDKQGCIWIGTTTQLYRMDKLSATFESVPINNTSSGDMICGILEDQSNNLWISTYKGLCKLAVASRKCNTYYASDGLQGDEFTIGVAYVDRRDGQYFFGGTNGITVFSPASVAVTPNQSVPVITALTLSNKQTSVPSEGAVFHLADNDNSFTVEFSQMDYLNASKAVYQYRMEGLSDEWRFTHAGGNQVSYGHVPPGRYTFTVRLVDRSSGESATSITIIVGRDMTVLVYVLLLLAGLVVAGGAVWLWHRQKKKEGAKKTSSYVSNFEI
jgi:streptogramin lyase